MKKASYHPMRTLPIGKGDAMRLVLEAVEEMPELQTETQRQKGALMQALRRVLREGIAAVRAQEQTVPFARAAEESLRCREKAGRRPTTLRDLRHFIRRLLRVPGAAERPLRAWTSLHCRQALEGAFGESAHSFRKGRAILHSIFAHGLRQQWCSQNPVDAVECPSVSEKEIEPLSLADCRRLVETARHSSFRDCLPALALMLFAGVRPGEVARLSWGDVYWQEGVLVIAGEHSKTGGARRVELCCALRRALRQLRPRGQGAESQPLCPPQWQRRWQRLRQVAGLSSDQRPWVADVLRHTFASYHALTYRNLPALQLQLGHRDARLLLTRYLNLRPLRRKDASVFWRMLA